TLKTGRNASNTREELITANRCGESLMPQVKAEGFELVSPASVSITIQPSCQSLYAHSERVGRIDRGVVGPERQEFDCRLKRRGTGSLEGLTKTYREHSYIVVYRHEG